MVVPVTSGFGHAAVRAAAVVPATLIVLFIGLLWLIGLACGEQRRAYVIVISAQAMGKAHDLLGTVPEARLLPTGQKPQGD